MENSTCAHRDLHLLCEDANVDLLPAKPGFYRVRGCAKSVHSFEEKKLNRRRGKIQKTQFAPRRPFIALPHGKLKATVLWLIGKDFEDATFSNFSLLDKA